MATKTLIGTSLSTWATGNFVGGVLPVFNDDVVIPRTATVSLNGSTLDRTADDSAEAGPDVFGLDLATLTLERDSQISVGSAATPLKLLVKTSVKHYGSGSLYLQPERDGGTVANMGTIKIDSPNSIDALVLTGTEDTALIELVAGGCQHTNAVVDRLIVAPNGKSPCYWFSSAGTICPLIIEMRGGTVEIYGDVDYTDGVDFPKIYMANGELIVHSGSDQAGGPDIIQWGGYCRYNGGDTGDRRGDYTLYGGVLDFSPLVGTTVATPSLRTFKRSRNAQVIGTYTATTENYLGE